jgi:Chitobiase/beta-hexosaminidase C-terminal domain
MRLSFLLGSCLSMSFTALVIEVGCGNPLPESLTSLAITTTPAKLSVGDAAFLHAVAHLSDGTTKDVTPDTQWSVSNASLATVIDGAITASAPGTVTVEATYVESTPAGSSPASASVSPKTLTASAHVSIAAPGTSNIPSISWPTPPTITYGTALGPTQLNATANVPGYFGYSPGAGTVVAAGTATVTATFTPSDTHAYSGAAARVIFPVKRAVPAVKWAPPSGMVQGVVLGPAQLNATANVPGTFTYNPAAGTTLPAGLQKLTVSFSPVDSADYSSVTKYQSLLVAPSAGTTLNVDPSMSTDDLQSTISAAPDGAVIAFASGVYTIHSRLVIPCNNLQLSGPSMSSPAAILSASYAGAPIFAYLGGCGNLGWIHQLTFANTGAVYVGPGNNSNLKFTNNVVSSLPSISALRGGVYTPYESGVFIDGTLSQTASKIDIESNTFGDASSCTVVFATLVDEGGSCAGIITHTGQVSNLTIKYNTFVHVEEGIHLLQIAAFAPGGATSVCISCTIEYNSISQYHRIAIEIQVSTPVDPILVEHNAIDDPISSSWGTYAVSMACCQSGFIQGLSGHSPGYMFYDNVVTATLPVGSECPPYGVEFWGNGSVGTNNLVQGTFCNGFSWGLGGGSWAIDNNYVCGPGFQTPGGGYITNERHLTNAPTMTGNVTGAVCSASPSTAPSIFPPGGSFSGSQTVTLSDAGPNTGIWYTTDGSLPVPGAGTARYYTGAFKVSSNTTVNAVGMWGTQNQPVSYPAGYGYVPSGVVSASFAFTSVVKGADSRITETNNDEASAEAEAITIVLPTAHSVVVGGTAQLKAIATFPNGVTRDVTSEANWKSSDRRTIAISSPGIVSGLASGTAWISASYRERQATVLVPTTFGEIDWSTPIVITRGGTYSGDWQSTDPEVAPVIVATTDPVILQDSHLSGAGNLIQVTIKGADLTVRNSLGLGQTDPLNRYPNGVLLEVNSPARLDVENNYMENVRGGILVHGYSGSPEGRQTLVIRANRARSFGARPGDDMSASYADRVTSSSFAELDGVQSVAGVDLGWNEVINYQSRGRVGDVVLLYRSSGTANNPLEIHDSYIEGAYQDQPKGAHFGGGIKVDGDADDTPEKSSAFASIHDNQVVGTVSYGIAFAAGHNNVAANNRIVSSGLLPDGTKITGRRVGLSNSDAYDNLGNGSLYNNSMHDNLVGWACWSEACTQVGNRQDQNFPAAPGEYSDNSVLPPIRITRATEESEYSIWTSKLAAAGVKVGPNF